MKILHIGDNVKHGHRFNGFYISELLNEVGHDSIHLVWDKNLNSKKTFEIKGKNESNKSLQQIGKKLNDFYGTSGLFYSFSYDLLFDKNFLECDIVHLHLIHNHFFGIEFLPIISKLKPIVWTFHDPWPLTGHCVHFFSCNQWQTGCGNCKQLETHFKVNHDSTALNWQIKKIIFDSSNINVIATSQWMTDLIKNSQFFNNSKIYEVPFGIDLNIFYKQTDKLSLRNLYNIPHNHIVIGFRSTNSSFKGINLLQELVEKLTNLSNITLVTFQEKGLFSKFNKNINIVELGWIEDDKNMSNAYNLLDIFIMPSYAETFGMMAIEAMACELALIVMNGTALEHITMPEKSNVQCFEYANATNLYEKVIYLINNRNIRSEIGKKSRIVVEEYYSKEIYLNNIIEVYKNVLTNANISAEANYVIDQQLKTKRIITNPQIYIVDKYGYFISNILYLFYPINWLKVIKVIINKIKNGINKF
jgi:glycosyltransferase involved in cell wall biosynthesis